MQLAAEALRHHEVGFFFGREPTKRRLSAQAYLVGVYVVHSNRTDLVDSKNGDVCTTRKGRTYVRPATLAGYDLFSDKSTRPSWAHRRSLQNDRRCISRKPAPSR
jgi:hypothetical protein